MKTTLQIIKKGLPFIFTLTFMLYCQPVEAQFLKKLKKKVEKAAENAVINKTAEKTEEETEKAMDSLFNKDKDTPQTSDQSINTGTPNTQIPSPDVEMETATNESTPVVAPWSKYNFVPGDEIIFEDNLMDEESGEFPSRWDLITGNAENAMLEGETVINLDEESIITPLMETNEYLPEVFTIEFDAFFDREYMPAYVYHQIYKLRLWSGPHDFDQSGNVFFHPIKVYRYGATLDGRINGQPREYESFEDAMKTDEPLWRHIAIAFNKRSLKLFVDQYRALNIPNLGFKPKQFSIEGYSNKHKKENGYIIAIKNIRIAEGGKKLYDRVVAEGKFVTRGILFDINKASIKPESMGVLNEVAKMMQEHPDLNFSIEGHTDADGDDVYNLKLSEQRAASVKSALVNLGIAENRMETKGLGESKPVSDNSTPEGKANNRRVEFIKK